jgi:hypothetical protein
MRVYMQWRRVASNLPHHTPPSVTRPHIYVLLLFWSVWLGEIQLRYAPPEALMLVLGAQMEAAVRVSLGVSCGVRCLQLVLARWLRWHLQPVSG